MNNFSQEIRECICGCGKTFSCRQTSPKKYIHCGHAGKKGYKWEKGCTPWNKGVFKKNDIWKQRSSEKASKTILKKIAEGRFRSTKGMKFPQLQGNNNPAKRPEVRLKISQAMITTGAAVYNCSCNRSPSKPQVALFKLVKNLYIDAVLNHPFFKRFVLDIAIPSKKINIEYDGSYWHRDSEKDKIRDEFIRQQGWAIIRYKDHIPSIEQLRKEIKNVVLP